MTYIGIGVNIGGHGQRLRLIMAALKRIEALPTTRIVGVSSLYETPPWGYAEQEAFYNGVVAIVTGLRPLALLHALKGLERGLGRKARVRWGPREIDLDILMMGGLRLVCEGLTVPHPQLTVRDFALVPLLELNGVASLPGGRRLGRIRR